jgi:serine/threonine protein kinase
MCHDIAQGTSHLHSHHILHRDLATRNILTNDNGELLVSDFGLSRHLSENDQTGDGYGHAAYYRMSSPTLLPIRWLAPESMEDLVFTVHSDTWMFGVCIWEIFVRSKTVPYAQIDNLNKVLVQVSTGKVKLQFPDWCPDETRAILMKCFRLDPIERPSMKELAAEFKRLVDRDNASPAMPVSSPTAMNTGQQSSSVTPVATTPIAATATVPVNAAVLVPTPSTSNVFFEKDEKAFHRRASSISDEYEYDRPVAASVAAVVSAPAVNSRFVPANNDYDVLAVAPPIASGSAAPSTPSHPASSDEPSYAEVLRQQSQPHK